MIPTFENNLASWKVHVTFRELIDIQCAAAALIRRNTDKPIVWLTKANAFTRLWVVRQYSTLTWVTADADPHDPHFALPIPESFLTDLVEIAAGTGVDLMYNEVEGVIIGKSGEHVVAVDHPVDVFFDPLDLPYLTSDFGSHDSPVVATMQMSDVSAFATAVHSHPKVEDHAELRVWPFSSVSIGNGRFSWTNDWRRMGHQRTTGSVPAHTQGMLATSFYPYMVANVIRTYSGENEVRVFIDGSDADYIYFVGDTWGIRVVNDAEHLARWSSSIRFNLSEAGCKVKKQKSERIPAIISFAIDGAECYASIHQVNDGLEEIIRYTYIASTGTPLTIAVLSKINELNDSLHGVRVTLRDEEVHVTVDFPADQIDAVDSHLASLRAGINATKNTQVFLALFAQ
jgi:hypothetical protein